MLNKNYIFLLVVLLPACGSGGSQEDTREIWIAAGQSNMAIGATFDNADIATITPSGLRTFHNGDFPALPALFSLAMKDRGKEIILAPIAIGSTSISCWQIDSPCFEGAKFLRGQKISGIIWWQGESDALDCSGEFANAYEARFSKMIADWRAYFGSEIPFYVVELGIYPTSHGDFIPCTQDLWEQVKSAQVEVANMPNVFLVNTDDITYGDIHPTLAYPEIARRLAALYN